MQECLSPSAVQACRHIISVDPEFVYEQYGSHIVHQAIRKRTMTCSCCDSTKYLWACLERGCGFIACQSSKSKHFESHFHQHNSQLDLSSSYASSCHSLAINLRTAVVWCFRCNTDVHSYDQLDLLSASVLLRIRTVIQNPRSLDSFFDPSCLEVQARKYQQLVEKKFREVETKRREERRKVRVQQMQCKQAEIIEKRKSTRQHIFRDPLNCPPQNKQKWSNRVTTGGVFIRLFPDKISQREYFFVDEQYDGVFWRDLRKPLPKPGDKIAIKDITSVGIGGECDQINELFNRLRSELRTDEQKTALDKRKHFVISIVTPKTSLFLETMGLSARNEWFLSFRYAVYHGRSKMGLSGLDIPIPEEIICAFDES
ncbi:hypothetical protein RCL1_008871 [Eukaryota sp. TZLM3-RCL]